LLELSLNFFDTIPPRTEKGGTDHQLYAMNQSEKRDKSVNEYKAGRGRKSRKQRFFLWSTWSTFGQHNAENNPHFPAFSRHGPK
jgi:hypothetical protein